MAYAAETLRERGLRRVAAKCTSARWRRPAPAGRFASFAIAAKVPLFELARFMGTSVKQIEET
jgi:hypothetical protein